MEELFKTIQISDKVIGDILEIDTVEAFEAFMCATVDTWCKVHNEHPADVMKTMVQASAYVNEQYGDMEEEQW